MESFINSNNEVVRFFNSLTAIEISVLVINLALMVFAKKIVALVYPESGNEKLKNNRVRVFRVLNAFIVIAIAYYHIHAKEGLEGLGFKLLLISLIIYSSFLVAHVFTYFIRHRYGKVREIEGNKKIIETYHSRLLTLFSGIFIFIISLIAIIQVLEFRSLLEAGGVIGFIGVFLALTQGAWAPDIFSGLIILNSGMIEEGDVIETSNGDSTIGIVYKTKIFHTEMLNMINNHRIMIRNARLRDMTVHNLSKFASARGLRESLHFKIGYSVASKKIRDMFLNAFEKAKKEASAPIEYQYPLEISMVDAGDHAVEWAIFYYTKDVKSLIKTRHYFRELVLDTSQEHGIELATPLTHVVDQQDKV